MCWSTRVQSHFPQTGQLDDCQTWRMHEILADQVGMRLCPMGPPIHLQQQRQTNLYNAAG